eukprot:3258254-Prymnesium_polylepis.1
MRSCAGDSTHLRTKGRKYVDIRVHLFVAVLLREARKKYCSCLRILPDAVVLVRHIGITTVRVGNQISPRAPMSTPDDTTSTTAPH